MRFIAHALPTYRCRNLQFRSSKQMLARMPHHVPFIPSFAAWHHRLTRAKLYLQYQPPLFLPTPTENKKKIRQKRTETSQPIRNQKNEAGVALNKHHLLPSHSSNTLSLRSLREPSCVLGDKTRCWQPTFLVGLAARGFPRKTGEAA